MPITTDIYGLSRSDASTDLKQLTGEAEVLIFGDTRQAEPAVKASVFGMLGQLAEQGVGKLWLEYDHRRQASLDPLLEPSVPHEEIAAWAAKVTKNNKALVGEGIATARDFGMKVGLIDDKAGLNAFKAENPEFIALQKLFRDHRKEGLGIEAAEAAALAGQSEEARQAYHVKELEWQQLRDGVDAGFAERVAAERGMHTKQAALVGDGHINTRNDFDDALRERNIPTKTVHVHEGLASYGEYLTLYIDRVPDDGNERVLPDSVYFADLKRFAQPDHPRLMETARKAYQMRENGVAFNPTGYAPPEQSKTR